VGRRTTALSEALLTRGMDIIGDVHGQADALSSLLRTMGYVEIDGVWGHPDRTAIFVGDYVDAGPQQLASIDIVRHMVDKGSARALMGNHEFNAICWYTEDPDVPGDFMRSRYSEKWGPKNRKQHAAFLAEVESRADLHEQTIRWFLTLPLWYEADGLRVVHACWDSAAIQILRQRLGPSGIIQPDLLPEFNRRGSELNIAIERVLKGQEVQLPAGMFFRDRDGTPRDHVRRRWWDPKAVTYRKSVLLPQQQADELPDDPLPNRLIFPLEYDHLTFFGHYCLPLGNYPNFDKFACVDTCAAKGDRLTAYRWDGEDSVDQDKFCSVPIHTGSID
jgi:hypothetical protein